MGHLPTKLRECNVRTKQTPNKEKLAASGVLWQVTLFKHHLL